MFDFFDNHKNPFMFMMNMMGSVNESEGEDSEGQNGFGMPFFSGMNTDSDPMQFMQQAFMMQMQFMQNMMMLPMQFMQGMTAMMEQNAPAGEAERIENSSEAQQGGFKLGNMNIPPELLRKLMQMDMTPENLEKLQRVLDFMFEAMPEKTEE